MINEYGVDPDVLNTAEEFYRITSLFGIDQFRLIRNFPDNWSGKVRKALKDVKPKQKLKLFEELEKISRTLIEAPYQKGIIPFTYVDQMYWIVNAEKYNTIYPFYAVISPKNPNALKHCIRPEEVSKDHPLINNKDCFSVERKPEKIAISIKSLLLYATDIHLVDPYFENMNNRHLRPFKEMLNILSYRESPNKIKRFIYHTGNIVCDDFLKQSLDGLVNSLPKGIELNIVRWPSDYMHNRFILTNLGGVKFGIGLDDDNNDPGQIKYDDISPLSPEVCLMKNCKGFRYMDRTYTIFYSITGKQ